MDCSIESSYNAAVVVTSDTCHRDPSQDRSGQYVKEKLKLLNFAKVSKIIVQDDTNTITNAVKLTLLDPNNVLTITVGGTGLCPRDVTPEATSVLYDKACSGIVAALHQASIRYSPHAALSRLTAGIAKSCLIVNFPGSERACQQCFDCLAGFLWHAIEQVRYDGKAIRETHERQKKEGYQDALTEKSQKCKEQFTRLSRKEEKEQSIEGRLEHLPSSNLNNDAPEETNKLQKVENLSPPSYSAKPIKIPEKRLVQDSPFPLIEFQDALDILSQLSQDFYLRTEVAVINSFEAGQAIIGATLAEKLVSKTVIPPYSVSTMDGYVLNISPTMRNKLSKMIVLQALLLPSFEEFRMFQEDPRRFTEFFCYQVNTGARVPVSNFTVIPIEHTGQVDGQNFVSIFKLTLDQYVREEGSDINLDYHIAPGTKIGPVELSVIHSMGYNSFRVVKQPVVGVLSTGDELISPYEFGEYDKSKVVDVNGPLLCSICKRNNMNVLNLGISKDNPKEILMNIRNNIERCDLLIITGGASMGCKDYAKDVIEALGAKIHFGRINIKPGKPAALASLMVNDKRKFIFALPGNPVSAFITFYVLVLPFIDHSIRSKFNSAGKITLNSLGEVITVKIGKVLDDDNLNCIPSRSDGRLEFARANFMQNNTNEESSALVAVSIKQQSSRLLSLKDCNCLLIIEPDRRDSLKFHVGQTYRALKVKQ